MAGRTTRTSRPKAVVATRSTRPSAAPNPAKRPAARGTSTRGASLPAAATLRALNRATLARQMLLERSTASPLAAVERLVAMQAQVARPPFVGLWSRVAGFERADLAQLVAARKVVRATFLRGTLHLLSAADYRTLRATLQIALTHGASAILRGRTNAIDLERTLAVGRRFFRERPRTFDALRDFLVERDRKADVRAQAYLVRLHLPLVQVPTDAVWGWPNSCDFALAESWLGKAIDEAPRPAELVVRYLAAFGPAGVTDFQTWSGFPPPAARAAFDAARDRLEVVHVERARELFDVPGAPRPPEDASAPVRFLPEFDNLVLSHADRRRFVADAHRSAVYLPGLRVAATFLVDGFVAGTWTIERAKDRATLALTPFGAKTAATRAQLEAEGEPLAKFLEPDAARYEVSIVGRRAVPTRSAARAR